MPSFLHYLPTLSEPIVLVTGDADESIGYDPTLPYSSMAPPIDDNVIQSILESPHIIKWFAQNCMYQHKKLIHMPIGMYYHTMSLSPIEQELEIKEIKKKIVPKKRIAYTTIHFASHRGDRKEVIEKVPKELVYYEPSQVSRKESHLSQMEYEFVLSPYGNGPDCHRTWEALVLGSIPIVRSSKMDPVFDGLPVLIINDWSEVQIELLNKTIESFSQKQFQLEKLKLSYWVNLIKNAGN